MAKHEFGIMTYLPRGDEEFVEYEPEKYGCISIDDEHIEALVQDFEDIPTYWHSLSRKMTGLNYIGITLISPVSCGKFSDVLSAKDASVYGELCALFALAAKEQKFVIHYGL